MECFNDEDESYDQYQTQMRPPRRLKQLYPLNQISTAGWVGIGFGIFGLITAIIAISMKIKFERVKRENTKSLDIMGRPGEEFIESPY